MTVAFKLRATADTSRLRASGDARLRYSAPVTAAADTPNPSRARVVIPVRLPNITRMAR